MVVGPNIGGNVEPAPSIAKWQTIKQHWHMHSTMTKPGGGGGEEERGREREKGRDREKGREKKETEEQPFELPVTPVELESLFL